MEPIAARLCAHPKLVDGLHKRIHRVVSIADWDDRAVRLEAARFGIKALTRYGAIGTWIIDDTGLLKQGKHSVGVQRQYTGSAGKTANCQIAVSLSVANDCGQLPIDLQLYLPESWASSPERREQARIPDDVEFKTKPDLALTMIHRALADGIPPGVVLADAAYGTSSDFRASLREVGLHFAVGVESQLKVWRIDSKLRRRGDPLSVADLAKRLRFRRHTWREGTKGPQWSKFAFARVVPYHDDGIDPSVREDVWLIAEWPDGEREPTKYTLCSLPSTTTKQRLVRTLKDRWRTERVYQDLKGELGFDHFEGRSYPGWHHHMSTVLCCAALLVAERLRRFPPYAQRAARRSAKKKPRPVAAAPAPIDCPA
jgi:SRSO17 transposase